MSEGEARSCLGHARLAPLVHREAHHEGPLVLGLESDTAAGLILQLQRVPVIALLAAAPGETLNHTSEALQTPLLFGFCVGDGSGAASHENTRGRLEAAGAEDLWVLQSLPCQDEFDAARVLGACVHGWCIAMQTRAGRLSSSPSSRATSMRSALTGSESDGRYTAPLSSPHTRMDTASCI